MANGVGRDSWHQCTLKEKFLVGPSDNNATMFPSVSPLHTNHIDKQHDA